MITLNNIVLPSPSTLSVTVTPQAGTSQYNSLGLLVQDGVKSKRTVALSWARMASAALASLSSVLAGNDFFTLVYPDPLSGSREMACRVREQSARVWRCDGAPQWADVKLILEER